MDKVFYYTYLDFLVGRIKIHADWTYEYVCRDETMTGSYNDGSSFPNDWFIRKYAIAPKEQNE